MSKGNRVRNRIAKKYFLKASDILENKVAPAWDFHIHSNYTDGKASIKEIFDVAIQEKLEAIVFTEHTEPWRNEDSLWYRKYYNEINFFRSAIFANRVKAFIGIESSAIDFNGSIDATNEMLETAEFILGAAHRYPGLGNLKVQELKNNDAIDLEYRTLIGLTMNQDIDGIAHVGATCKKYCTLFPLHLVREIVSLASHQGIAIELNPIYNKPLIPFLEICAEENALITLGSNAHGYGDIGLVSKELNKLFKS